MTRARERHRVGRASDLPPGRHTVVRAGNRELGIFNIGGTLHALPEPLPAPARAALQRRDVGHAGRWRGDRLEARWRHEGEIVTCPWHGLEFHVPTGQCMAWPEIRLRTYDVAVVDGEIEVAL